MRTSFTATTTLTIGLLAALTCGGVAEANQPLHAAATSSPAPAQHSSAAKPATGSATPSTSSTSGASASTSGASPDSSNDSKANVPDWVEQGIILTLKKESADKPASGKNGNNESRTASDTVDTKKLPSMATIFTANELKHVIPGLRGAQTQGNTINLDLPSDPSDNHSRLTVTFKRNGTTSDVEKAWSSELSAHHQRADKNPGLYTFYGKNKFGVTDSFTDGTTTHVLLEHDGAAEEIWFTGIGFSAIKGSYSSSRHEYVSTLTPALIQLLGDKLAKGNELANTP